MKLLCAVCLCLLSLVFADEDTSDTSVNVFEQMTLGCHHVPRCARNWVCSRTSCYHFSNEKVTARQALLRCRKFNADLVEINNAAEYNFLRKQAEARYLPSDFWIALTDALEEGKWNWMNSWNTLSFSRWYPGQPNNHHNEDCVHMSQWFKFQWNDVPCRLRKQYVCEK